MVFPCEIAWCWDQRNTCWSYLKLLTVSVSYAVFFREKKRPRKLIVTFLILGVRSSYFDGILLGGVAVDSAPLSMKKYYLRLTWPLYDNHRGQILFQRIYIFARVRVLNWSRSFNNPVEVFSGSCVDWDQSEKHERRLNLSHESLINPISDCRTF